MKTIKWCNFHNVTMARCDNTASRSCVLSEINEKIAILRAKEMDFKDERFELLDEVKEHFAYSESKEVNEFNKLIEKPSDHLYDLVQKGKLYDAMKEQRDELLKALKEVLPAFYNDEPEDFHQRRGSYYESIKRLYSTKIEVAEKAIKATE